MFCCALLNAHSTLFNHLDWLLYLVCLPGDQNIGLHWSEKLSLANTVFRVYYVDKHAYNTN